MAPLTNLEGVLEGSLERLGELLEGEDVEADSGLGNSKIKSLISTLHEYRLSVY